MRPARLPLFLLACGALLGGCWGADLDVVKKAMLGAFCFGAFLGVAWPFAKWVLEYFRP